MICESWSIKSDSKGKGQEMGYIVAQKVARKIKWLKYTFKKMVHTKQCKLVNLGEFIRSNSIIGDIFVKHSRHDVFCLTRFGPQRRFHDNAKKQQVQQLT